MTQSQSQTAPSLPTSLQSDVVFDASFLDFLIDFRLKSEPQSELYNFHARFYDPVIGRFISHDAAPPSLEQPLSLNRYSYVYNNPLKFVDPDGNRATTAEYFYYAMHPIKAIQMYSIRESVFSETDRFAIENDFDASSFHNGEADAFRHSLLAIKTTRKFGKMEAFRILNNHEIGSDIPANEIQMDMFNNMAGINAATNPKFNAISDFDLASLLFNTNQLQTGLLSDNQLPFDYNTQFKSYFSGANDYAPLPSIRD